MSEPYIAADAGLPARSRALAALIAITLIAGIVGAVVVGSDTGGNTPEDAVRSLVAAAEAHDGLGVIESLLPAERDVLRQPVRDIVGQLERLQVVKPGVDLRNVPGVETHVTGLTLSTEVLADNVADVSVTGGTVTVAADAGQLKGSAIAVDAKPTTETTNLADEHVVVATVKDGGRWYVSLTYSLAEAARHEAKKPVPTFGHGVAAKGADSPEAVVRDAVNAAVAFDVRRLIELTPADEAAALHDYAPLFITDAEKAAADLRGHTGAINVTRLDLSSSTSGDTARVKIAGFQLNWPADGRLYSVDWDGKCLTIKPAPEGQPTLCADPSKPSLIPANVNFTVTTVRRDGQWYVSPTATFLGLLVAGLKALPDNAFTANSPLQGLFNLGLVPRSEQKSIEIAPLRP